MDPKLDHGLSCDNALETNLLPNSHQVVFKENFQHYLMSGYLLLLLESQVWVIPLDFFKLLLDER